MTILVSSEMGFRNLTLDSQQDHDHHTICTPGLKNPATPFRKTPKNVPVTCVMSSSSTKGGCEGCAANPRALASAKGLMMTHARHLFRSLSVSWSWKNHSKNHPN